MAPASCGSDDHEELPIVTSSARQNDEAAETDSSQSWKLINDLQGLETLLCLVRRLVLTARNTHLLQVIRYFGFIWYPSIPRPLPTLPWPEGSFRRNQAERGFPPISRNASHRRIALLLSNLEALLTACSAEEPCGNPLTFVRLYSRLAPLTQRTLSQQLNSVNLEHINGLVIHVTKLQTCLSAINAFQSKLVARSRSTTRTPGSQDISRVLGAVKDLQSAFDGVAAALSSHESMLQTLLSRPAIIYQGNNVSGNARVQMGNTYGVPSPAVPQADGELIEVGSRSAAGQVKRLIRTFHQGLTEVIIPLMCLAPAVHRLLQTQRDDPTAKSMLLQDLGQRDAFASHVVALQNARLNHHAMVYTHESYRLTEFWCGNHTELADSSMMTAAISNANKQAHSPGERALTVLPGSKAVSSVTAVEDRRMPTYHGAPVPVKDVERPTRQSPAQLPAGVSLTNSSTVREQREADISAMQAFWHATSFALWRLANSCKKTRCKTRSPSSEGRLRCTSSCGFSTKFVNEWREHEERRQPQRVWVCNLCLKDQKVSQSPPYTTDRIDKLKAHAVGLHRYKNLKTTGEIESLKVSILKNKRFRPLSVQFAVGRQALELDAYTTELEDLKTKYQQAVAKKDEMCPELIAKSVVDLQNSFESTCSFACSDAVSCGHVFTSWDERLEHWLTHLGADRVADQGESGSGASQVNTSQKSRASSGKSKGGGGSHGNDHNSASGKVPLSAAQRQFVDGDKVKYVSKQLMSMNSVNVLANASIKRGRCTIESGIQWWMYQLHTKDGKDLVEGGRWFLEYDLLSDLPS